MSGPWGTGRLLRWSWLCYFFLQQHTNLIHCKENNQQQYIATAIHHAGPSTCWTVFFSMVLVSTASNCGMCSSAVYCWGRWWYLILNSRINKFFSITRYHSLWSQKLHQVGPLQPPFKNILVIFERNLLFSSCGLLVGEPGICPIRECLTSNDVCEKWK